MKNIFKLIVLILGLLLMRQVSAAGLYLKTDVSEFTVGRQFLVDVLIDAEDETLNATEGSIIFPVELVKVTGIFERDSVINIWLEKPRLDKKKNRISWSGFTPGGFGKVLSPVGLEPARLFSVVFEAKKAGTGEIGFEGVRFLRNDGEGTLVELETLPFEFTVINDAGFESKAGTKILTDTEPPQEFTPLVMSDPAIFNERWFLVFNTQDKESGIARYEVLERKDFPGFGFWKTAESPYLLKDQSLRSHIYVKATDKFGNERVAHFPPTYPLSGSEKLVQWVIIILVVSAVIFGIRKILLWRKN